LGKIFPHAFIPFLVFKFNRGYAVSFLNKNYRNNRYPLCGMGTTTRNKNGVKNSLVNNINANKKKGTSKPKSKSTVSKKAYSDMKSNWQK
jgi:hypothetical protein